MFVLFGFGHTKVKKVGETRPEQCSNCNNTNAFHIVERSKWFTLFFIPVFPYSREKAVVCPICNKTKLLAPGQEKSIVQSEEAGQNRKEQLQNREQQLKNQLDKGEIDLNAYKKQMNLLKFE